MDSADRAGLSVAVIGHIALFGALSLGLAVSIPPKPVPPPSMEVAFVEEVALQPSAEPVTEPMATAQAPEIGAPEEAMPQPAPVAEPLPPPPPVALAPPPAPVPTPKPPTPKPPAPKPKPLAARPPAPKPLPKPARAKPVEVRREPAAAKPAAAKVKPAPAKAKPAAAKPNPPAAKAAPSGKTVAKASAASGAGQKTASRAPRLGKNFLAGLSDPSPGKADKPSAPAISANAMAGIQAAIKRQIQPCANRQVNPGPGASRILVKLNLRLKKDGSLASAPRVVSTSGVDDENSRYEKRVADLAIAAYTGCAPMKGLPEDLYRTAKGGWNNVNMNYKLPG